MPVPPRPIAPELLAEARRLYEQTRVPVDDIAALLGMGTRTVFTRMRKWGWRRRILRIPRDRPPPDPVAEPTGVPMTSPDDTANCGTPAERIQRAVERQIAAVEQIVMRLRPASEHITEAERAARVLASLTRTLREVSRLDATRADARSEDTNDDRGPEDTDEFLRELARRMDAFADARTGPRLPAAGKAGAD